MMQFPIKKTDAHRESAYECSRRKNNKIAVSAVLAVLGLMFSYIEAVFPFSVGISGVKLGIANLVVIVALYLLGGSYAFAINIIRVVLAGLLFSGVFGMMYSLAGALLSYIVMYLLKKTGMFSMTGVSMAGGVAHNCGQLLIAAAIISNIKMFAYFPVLLFSGMITGIIIGVIGQYVYSKLLIAFPQYNSR